jgi:hypothetical protein
VTEEFRLDVSDRGGIGTAVRCDHTVAADVECGRDRNRPYQHDRREPQPVV